MSRAKKGGKESGEPIGSGESRGALQIPISRRTAQVIADGLSAAIVRVSQKASDYPHVVDPSAYEEARWALNYALGQAEEYLRRSKNKTTDNS